MEQLRDGDPKRLGDYQLVALLGAGGMGRVYLGRDAAGHRVAVKVVNTALARDAAFLRRFQREIAATSDVGGAYVAAVVAADPEGDPPWLATEYVPGPSLHTVVTSQGPLTAAAVRELGTCLAEGLAVIHAASLVHRDLKPANILMADTGPKIIDFGIARDAAASKLTDTGMALGTPTFMAPEQLAGDPVGPAADVFALGAVLMFAATGRYAFGEGDLRQLLYRTVHQDPDLAGVPDELKGLLGRCLAKEPGERPSAVAVAEALRGAEALSVFDAGSAASPSQMSTVPGRLDAPQLASSCESSADPSQEPASTDPLRPPEPREPTAPDSAKRRWPLLLAPTDASQPPEPREPTAPASGKRRWPLALAAAVGIVALAFAIALGEGASGDTARHPAIVPATTASLAGTTSPQPSPSPTPTGPTSSSPSSTLPSPRPTTPPTHSPSSPTKTSSSSPQPVASTSTSANPPSSPPATPACGTPTTAPCRAAHQDATPQLVDTGSWGICMIAADVPPGGMQVGPTGNCAGTTQVQFRVYYGTTPGTVQIESVTAPNLCLREDTMLRTCDPADPQQWFQAPTGGTAGQIHPYVAAGLCLTADTQRKEVLFDNCGMTASGIIQSWRIHTA